MTYRIVTTRNGVEVTGGRGFKTFRDRAKADAFAAQLNAHAARHAPLLRARGTTIVYTVTEDA